MSNFKSCTPAKAGDNIITCEVVLAYPNLFKPSLRKGETDESKKRYSVTLLVPKGHDISMLVDRVNEVGSGAYGKNLKFRKPFIKTADQQGKIGEFAEEYPTMIRVASKRRPNIIFPNGKVCDDPEQTYSGRKARVSVDAFAWDPKSPGGAGVSLGLGNVQLLDHGDPLPLGGGRMAAEDEFEAVEVSGETGSVDDIYS